MSQDRPARRSDKGPRENRGGARPSRRDGAGRDTSGGRGQGGAGGRGRGGGRGEGRDGSRASGRPGDRAQTSARPRTTRATEPTLDDDVTAAELDPTVRRSLRSLPKDLADTVACHLVMAGRLVDDDPELAYRHAAFARDRASRVAATREAAGVTAYMVGDFAQALSDLRAHRRMTGSPEHLPLMADCERGLGRPERALALSRDAEVARLDPAARMEMRIVESGARRDLGEYDAAVVTLQVPELEQDRVQPWTVRLWYAYADALLAAGRRDDAVTWFGSVAAIDEDEQTDAAERLAELEGQLEGGPGTPTD